MSYHIGDSAYTVGMMEDGLIKLKRKNCTGCLSIEDPYSITQIINKKASVARRVKLDEKMEISDGWGKIGDLVVYKVLETGNVTAELELASGRITEPSAGDVVLGVIGNRRAIAKVVANVPPEGIEINQDTELVLLNRGGMIGRIEEQIQSGRLTKVQCLGVVKRNNKIVNIRDFRLPYASALSKLPPLLVVGGTNMEVGKTEVCCGLIRGLTKLGLRVCAAKLTGIASLRDILRLKDAGAFEVVDFVDGGLATTLKGENVLEAAFIQLNYLSSHSPDIIVVELGGSVMLGASLILNSEDLRKYFSGLVLASGDITAAFGGVEALKQFYRLPLNAIGGPVANSDFFRKEVKAKTGVQAYDFRDVKQSQNFLYTNGTIANILRR